MACPKIRKIDRARPATAAGDSFTVLETWMDLDSQGRVTQVVRQEGDTLSFTNQTFSWLAFDAAIGDYVIGFIVEDLDGNITESYQKIRVE